MTTLNHKHRFNAADEQWLSEFGEVELIGGWAEVALDDEFSALIDCPGYQVFLTSYDPVQLFVQNRNRRSFEIHAMPGPERRKPMSTQCGYWVVGRRATKSGETR